MFNKRWAILWGILAMAAVLVVTARLAVAEEGPPPVEPAGVGIQADLLWDQLYPVGYPGGSTVASYMPSSEWVLAADDFFVTGTVPVHNAWIISQVVVQASVDQYFPGLEKATVCFYRDSSGPTATAITCTPSLSASASQLVDSTNWVLTYTLPSSPLLLTTYPRYWVSVQMSGTSLDGRPIATWFWRSRSESEDNPHFGSQPFAYRTTLNWLGPFGDSCRGQWQVQRPGTGNNCNDASDWPAGKDLAFKLIGSYFDGTPRAYLPLLRR